MSAAVLEPRRAQADEYAEEHREVEACRELWRTVMAYTVFDLQYLERFSDRSRLNKRQLHQVRAIERYPPEDFLASEWFREICSYLVVDPRIVLNGVEERLELVV